MKTRNILLPVTFAIVALSSCKKESADANQSSAQGIQFQLQTTNRTSNLNRTEASTIVWTAGTASVTMIKFEAKNASNQEIEFKSLIAQQVNLFTPVATTLGNVTLPDGTYQEVEFKITADKTGNTPALELTGQLTNSSGTVIPITFLANSRIELKAEQHNVVVSGTSSTTALTSLNLALLTSGISQSMLSNATVTNGTIIISTSSNANLYNIITTNLIRSHEVEVHHH